MLQSESSERRARTQQASHHSIVFLLPSWVVSRGDASHVWSLTVLWGKALAHYSDDSQMLEVEGSLHRWGWG